MRVSRHTVATAVNEFKNLLEEHGDWIVCGPRPGYFLKVLESEDMIRRGWISGICTPVRVMKIR